MSRVSRLVVVGLILTACGQNIPSAESTDDTHLAGTIASSDSSISPANSVELDRSSSDRSTATVAVAPNVTTPNGNVNAAADSSRTIEVATTVGTVTTTTVLSEVGAMRITCDAVPGATCAGADLRGRDLMFANLQGADFRNAILNGVDFSGADLSGANFSGANLTNANLSETVLFGTDFTGARMNMTNVDFVLWDDSTIWPAGFTPPDF